MHKPLFLMVTIMLVLAACGAPGQSTANVQAQVETSVAMTMDARDGISTSVAETVAAQAPSATLPPTLTPISPTFTPIVPTFTPFVTVPPTSGSGGGGGSTTADYSCDVISRRPFDYAEFHRGDDFDIKWTIVNNGRKAWPAGFDLKYVSGPKMTTTTILELPALKPKEQHTIVFDATAPAERGKQVMIWMVQGKLCYPYTAIIVK